MNTSYLNYESSYLQYPVEYLKGMGRIFYMINPKEAFENVEEVPNFYVQSWPYFLTFMLMEHIILKLEGKKGIRLNDGITSISNGLFLECGRLIWRGAESYLYTWVYNNYKLFDLPWDSTSTWVIAALGIDFGYYWMHRACHEIHILWAQHQVHHTSEDFNMGVGIRQSVLQGWVGILFYLPLALAIPPAQFVMHHQFSYLYMFWIHTEAIKSLGPLEYILNTPSHHRIHHGSNPYCLDVNYGGVLIIWDKIFGTFREEKNTDKIIYGLIFNQPSFNPLVLQTFYTRINVANKLRNQQGWWNKFLAVVHRPSWAPGGYKRFKELEEDPIVHTRIKYDVVLPKWCTAYLLTHYGLVLYGFYQLFLVHLGMSPMSVLLLVTYILASLTIFGMILDASTKAPYLEVFRCLSMFVLSKFLTSIIGFTISPPWQMFYLISAGFWLLFVFKTIEIKVEKKGL